MQTLDRDHVSITVDASPEEVYALVSDVTRTPDLSPEILRCTWLDGATGPAVGARFEAVNKAGRGPAWKNRPVVVTADPGREFAFERTEPLSGSLRWTYRLQPHEEGRPSPSPTRSPGPSAGSAGSSSTPSTAATTAGPTCATA